MLPTLLHHPYISLLQSETSTPVTPITLGRAKVKEPTNDNLTGTNSHNFGLEFLEIPKGDDLKIHELQRQEDQPLLFEPFSRLIGYLLPGEFPIDIFRQAYQQNQYVHIWITQIVKVEILVILWVIFWAILSISLPVGVAVFFCSSRSSLFPNGSIQSSRRWTEKTLGCLLHLFLILMLCPVILILIANEQIARSVNKAPHAVNVIHEDIATFIRNTHMQISFVTTSSTDMTIEAIRKKLEDIDLHLGRPYQLRLSSETEMNLGLASLQEIKSEAVKVSSVIADLLADCTSAAQADIRLQGQLQDISRQLMVIQQQCVLKDRPLCFSIQFSGYEEPLKLTNLTSDSKVLQISKISKEKTLNTSLDMALRAFNDVPAILLQDSSTFIADIKTILSRKRTQVYKSTHDLDILVRTLLQEVTESQKAIFALVDAGVKWDLWRWIAILGVAAVVGLTWSLLICGAPCGCKTTSQNAQFLKGGIGLASIGCILLWALGTVALLIGGHGSTLLCRPLFDHPRYSILGQFLDVEGVLYPKTGLFDIFSNENHSVKVAEVLRGCQRDQASHPTFHLKNFLDLDTLLNYKTWTDLDALLEVFATSKTKIEVLSPSLQLNLQILASNTAANFTPHREAIAFSHRKDLASFADQLNNIARQLTDSVISRRIDNLAFSVRNVVQDEMQRLNDLRGRILYKITMLEVLLPPLNRRVNQSLSHLKTIQFFLDSHQGWHLSETVRREFITKIENHLVDLYEHASEKVTKEIGKCRPLWDIFHATRIYMCKSIFDPFNAAALASYFLIVVLIALTPVSIKLIGIYTEENGSDTFHSLKSLGHRDSRQRLLSEESRVWVSPASASSEGSENIPIAWTSPPSRPPPQPQGPIRIPEPPASFARTSSRTKNKFSAFTSRTTGARNNQSLQIPTASKSRASRRWY